MPRRRGRILPHLQPTVRKSEVVGTVAPPQRTTTGLPNRHDTYSFHGLPHPYTTVDGDSIYALAVEFDMPISVVYDINSHVALPTDVNASLPCGLALTLSGSPAVPPLSTTVSVNSRADVLAIATAYGLLDSLWAKRQTVCANL